MGESLAIKIINIVFYVLFAVSVLLGIIFFAVNKNEEPLIVGGYILTIVSVGSILLFGVVNMFKSKSSIITSLGIIGAFVVLIGISYAFASSVIPLDAAGELVDEALTASGSRWSGASLYLLYILLAVSFISLIFTEIRGAFK
ncbi:MAG: hypothetical protein PF517_01115 [Salinivirgaceae bacterium]|jgi:heme A synthase|nr:hypothetical protein [Salinivirgaceae bacterium]